MILKRLRPIFSTKQGVRYRIQDGDSVSHFLNKTGADGLVDGYDVFLSWLFFERRILLTMSPSLVRNINPSLSLSNRPTGKMRFWCLMASIIFLRSPLVSVVETIPLGLL